MIDNLAGKALRPIVGRKLPFHSIDLMRGLAAITVLVFHYKNFGGGGADLNRGPEWFAHMRLLQALSPIREYGGWAVNFFWMLSGLVFMNQYAGRKSDTSDFWRRRFARLYPLHLVTLIAVTVIQTIAISYLGHSLIYVSNSPVRFASHLMFASSWLSVRPETFNGPVWSVSLEVLIYAAFYFYIRGVRTSIASVSAVFLAFLAAALLTHGAAVMMCGTFFFGGAVAYLAIHHCPPSRLAQLRAASAAVLVGAIMLGLAVGPRLPLTFWLLAIFGSLLLLGASSEETALRRLFVWAKPVGDITYSTYLWHSPIQMAFLLGAGLGVWRVEAAFSDTFLAIYVAVVCLVAYASHRLIEMPAQALIRGKPVRKASVRATISMAA